MTRHYTSGKSHLKKAPILPVLVLVSVLAAGMAFFSLKVTTKIEADSSQTFTPVGDAYIDSSVTGTNFGSVTPLIVSASVRRGLLKFNTALPAGSTVTSVTLRLFTPSSISSAGFEIHPEGDSWTESGVTWANQPTWNASVLATSGVSTANTWVSVGLPVSSVNVSGNTNLGIKYSTSGINAKFSSREDSVNQPQLVINYTTVGSTPTPVVTPLVTPAPTPIVTTPPVITPSPIPTAIPTPVVTASPPPLSGDPVIVAVGDMVCGSGDVGKNYPCQAAATANLVGQINPNALLVLGDNQYEGGSFSDFTTYYTPTYGLYKLITYPVPGNHEYGASGANGYYKYFGSQASPQDVGCTTNCKGYYSYDLGNWHIIALNSECSKVPGGCAAGSPEETWLKADLAAVPAEKCIMAYWHEGHWSSGHDGNNATITGSTTPFVQDLYNAHADVILGGHSHDYERFDLQNPSSLADPLGLRQFIVGNGGRDFTGWWTTTLANSQVRNNKTFGVLKMVLHSASYDWQMIPATGINGYVNGTFTDSGSTNCH